MIKKIFVSILIVILSIIFASLFGILHDQVTYRICNEYFTKFKFIQFGLTESDNTTVANPLVAVSIVGVLATWWVGIFIGIILGSTGLIFPDHRKMLQATLYALWLTFLITILLSFTGFIIGRFYLIKTGVSWWQPEHLINKDGFIIAGSIHNFSYLGGLAGMITGVIYLIRKNKVLRKMYDKMPTS